MRRNAIWLCWLGVAVFLLAGSIGQNAQAQPAVDHYKFYTTNDPLVFIPDMYLTDQFGETFHPAHQSPLFRFGTPVSKNQEPILNPFAHMAWYDLFNPEPIRNVEVWDQFGAREWRLGDAHAILVPAIKNGSPGEPLPELNHYKCYEVLWGPTYNIPVTLDDQFGSTEAVVLEARYLCNPADKFLQTGYYPVVDSLAHLAIYDIQELTTLPETAVNTEDQFKPFSLVFISGHADFLAVPAFKEDPIAVEESTWGKIKSLYKDGVE